MRPILIGLSSAITIAATIPYLIEIARGKTKPRLVTWFIWALLAGIGAAAAFAQGQIPAGVFIMTTSVESIAVVILGFKKGDRSFEKLDLFCLIGAFVGLGIWLFLKSPNLAVTMIILVDATGTIPTIKHCWQKPLEETWSTYALFVLAEVIVLAITGFQTYTGYAYTVFYLAADVALVMILLFSPHLNESPVLEVPDNPAPLPTSPPQAPAAPVSPPTPAGSQPTASGPITPAPPVQPPPTD